MHQTPFADRELALLYGALHNELRGRRIAG
jgi:hypothetical protein